MYIVNKCSCRTTSRCGCTCTPTTAPVTPTPTPAPTTPAPAPTTTTTLADLIAKIDAKCDKTACDAVQTVCDAILADITELQADTATLQDAAPIDVSKYQLISNMVDSLEGDLTAKYPSAAVIKTKLTELWTCMYSRHKNHGEWSTNVVVGNVTGSADSCKQEDNVLPSTVSQQIPIDIGDTVTNNGCVYMSTVENNAIKPDRYSVMHGKYLNFCDIKDVIDCVKPRRLATAAELAVDPTHKVVFLPTLCEQVAAISDKYITAFAYNPSTSKYDITLSNGTTISAVLPKNDGLPSGSISFSQTILGTFDTVDDGTNMVFSVGTGNAQTRRYLVLPKTITFSVTDYPYLAVAGRKVSISVTTSSNIDIANPVHANYQWDTRLKVNGTIVKDMLDGYWLASNAAVFNGIETLTDVYSVDVTTTGGDLVIETAQVLEAQSTIFGITNAIFQIDISRTLVTFSAKD